MGLGARDLGPFIADVHHYGLDAKPRPELYLSFSQNVFAGMAIVVRTQAEPREFASALRETIWALDDGQAIYDISTMEEALSRWVFLPRLSMILLAAL